MRDRPRGVDHVDGLDASVARSRADGSDTEHDARSARTERSGQSVEQADAGNRGWQRRDLEYLSLQPFLELQPRLLGPAQTEDRRHADALVRIDSMLECRDEPVTQVVGVEPSGNDTGAEIPDPALGRF